MFIKNIYTYTHVHTHMSARGHVHREEKKVCLYALGDEIKKPTHSKLEGIPEWEVGLF